MVNNLNGLIFANSGMRYSSISSLLPLGILFLNLLFSTGDSYRQSLAIFLLISIIVSLPSSY
jgi:hypothetical protein